VYDHHDGMDAPERGGCQGVLTLPAFDDRFCAMKQDLKHIVPEDFPELKLLAWSRDPQRPLPAAEAFSLYERNWRFVDRQRLTDRESGLIRALATEFGHGRLLI
jgi:hypothetical protein